MKKCVYNYDEITMYLWTADHFTHLYDFIIVTQLNTFDVAFQVWLSSNSDGIYNESDYN